MIKNINRTILKIILSRGGIGWWYIKQRTRQYWGKVCVGWGGGGGGKGAAENFFFYSVYAYCIPSLKPC